MLARGCHHPGCPNINCEEHPRAPWNADRVTRVRGRQLQRLRTQLFAAEPLCRVCKAAGRLTVATIRDHIVPLAEGGDEAPSNIQPLCQACSDLKTQGEAVRGRARTVR